MDLDTILACVFPLALLLLAFKFFFKITLSEIFESLPLRRHRASRNLYFSLERAYHSYSQYKRLSTDELSRLQTSYHTLQPLSKNLGDDIGYQRKLDKLRDVTALNATITEAIARLAEKQFPSLMYQLERGVHMVSPDLGLVRESLKHCIRDWSKEGVQERMRTFSPILDILKEVDPSRRSETKILVPGCGLGRLAWEISQLGFDTTANEHSFFMSLALRFLFSPGDTDSIGKHRLYPYAHSFSHQQSNESLFRCLSFPDVIPCFTPNFRLVEQDFLTLPIPCTEPSANQLPTSSFEGYDFIVTLFFIDNSHDVFATMKHIYALLRPGGSWINLGPLLWTAQAKVKLSLDEVLLAAERIGFVLAIEEKGTKARRTVECEYTSDPNAMMRWIYKAQFWVARKPETN